MTMTNDADDSRGFTTGRMSFVDRDSHFNGSYVTSNDIRIEGRYEGEIECNGTLIVAESADVNARISAGNISVAGRLQGEIGCRGRFEILPRGHVEARVQAGTIVIHEGAQYDGELRMTRDESSQSAMHFGQRAASPSSRRRATAEEPEEAPPFPITATRGNGRGEGKTAEPEPPSAPSERRAASQ